MGTLISKGRSDEVFVISAHSLQIDIAKLIDAINNSNVKFEQTEMDTSYLSTFIRSNMISMESLLNMKTSRRDEPLLISYLMGEKRIIDGNHRFVKRQEEGFSQCKVIALHPEVLEDFKEPPGK